MLRKNAFYFFTNKQWIRCYFVTQVYRDSFRVRVLYRTFVFFFFCKSTEILVPTHSICSISRNGWKRIEKKLFFFFFESIIILSFVHFLPRFSSGAAFQVGRPVRFQSRTRKECNNTQYKLSCALPSGALRVAQENMAPSHVLYLGNKRRIRDWTAVKTTPRVERIIRHNTSRYNIPV